MDGSEKEKEAEWRRCAGCKQTTRWIERLVRRLARGNEFVRDRRKEKKRGGLCLGRFPGGGSGHWEVVG